MSVRCRIENHGKASPNYILMHIYMYKLIQVGKYRQVVTPSLTAIITKTQISSTLPPR